MHVTGIRLDFPHLGGEEVKVEVRAVRETAGGGRVHQRLPRVVADLLVPGEQYPGRHVVLRLRRGGGGHRWSLSVRPIPASVLAWQDGCKLYPSYASLFWQENINTWERDDDRRPHQHHGHPAVPVPAARTVETTRLRTRRRVDDPRHHERRVLLVGPRHARHVALRRDLRRRVDA